MLLSNWQVFWLNPQLMAFPFLNSGKENKLFCDLLCGGGLYSYGDSAGITPDFPF
jgi:hypothetical protein